LIRNSKFGLLKQILQAAVLNLKQSILMYLKTMLGKLQNERVDNCATGFPIKSDIGKLVPHSEDDQVN
jgi:hypothetical protein